MREREKKHNITGDTLTTSTIIAPRRTALIKKTTERRVFFVFCLFEKARRGEDRDICAFHLHQAANFAETAMS